MSARKPYIVNLKISIAQVEYVVGFLSINHKQEIFYNLRYPDSLNGSSYQVLNLQTNKYESVIDHISWHDKVVNIKHRDNSRYQYSNDLLPKDNDLKPIFVECFYEFEALYLACLSTDFKRQNSPFMDDQLIAKLDKYQNFSLVFFLIPKNFEFNHCYVTSDSLKLHIGFNQIFTDAGKIVGRFDNFDVWVCVMLHVAKLSNLNINISSPLRNFCANKPENFFEQILIDNKNKF